MEHASESKPADKNPFAVALVKAGGKFYITLNRDKTVAAFPSVEAGLASFQNMYDRNHSRGQVGSASACINYMTFQPAIVLFKSLDELRKKLLDSSDEDLKIVELSHVSGYMLGIEADQEKAAGVWDVSCKPGLISNDLLR